MSQKAFLPISHFYERKKKWLDLVIYFPVLLGVDDLFWYLEPDGRKNTSEGGDDGNGWRDTATERESAPETSGDKPQPHEPEVSCQP